MPIAHKKINGTALADSLNGGNGNDTLYGNLGVDSLYGGLGNDIYIIARAEEHTDAEISDSDGINRIWFTSSIDQDTLVISAMDVGVSEILAGTLKKSAFTDSSTTDLNIDARLSNQNITLKGNAGENHIQASDYNDSLYGGAGADSLYGYDGDDYLDGGKAADLLTGGEGNDTYLADTLDTIVDSGGYDLIKSALAGYVLPDNIEALTLIQQAKNGSGNHLDNTLTGNALNNNLKGLSGNDQLFGNGGNDQLFGGTGNDYISGGSGQDTAYFRGNIKDYSFFRQGKNIIVQGLDGEDTLSSVELLKFGNSKAVGAAALKTEDYPALAIDSLKTSQTWPIPIITYSFMTAIPGYDQDDHKNHKNFQELSSHAKALVAKALQNYADIANVLFLQVADSDLVNIRVGSEQMKSYLYGYAYLPEPEYGGDVWINNMVPEYIESGDDGFLFEIINHELGHALGLKHPGNYSPGKEIAPYLPANQDNNLYTVMSYNGIPRDTIYRGLAVDRSIYPTTPMLYDILAIQNMYGANMSFNVDNNDYVFDQTQPFFKSLWDAGGEDSIDTSSFTRHSNIDLRDGHFSSIGIGKQLGTYTLYGGIEEVTIPKSFSAAAIAKTLGKNGYTGTNNLAIAYDTVIENAMGGAGDDTIRGNSYDNKLYGNAGDDTISAGAGNDYLEGGDGTDTLTGSMGSDIFVFTLAEADDTDSLTDFEADHDLIYLTQTSGDLASGNLDETAFASGNFFSAQDADDRVIFNSSSKQLWFDVDGFGGQAAYKIADFIADSTAPTYLNFIIV